MSTILLNSLYVTNFLFFFDFALSFSDWLFLSTTIMLRLFDSNIFSIVAFYFYPIFCKYFPDSRNHMCAHTNQSWSTSILTCLAHFAFKLSFFASLSYSLLLFLVHSPNTSLSSYPSRICSSALPISSFFFIFFCS